MQRSARILSRASGAILWIAAGLHGALGLGVFIYPTDLAEGQALTPANEND